VLVDVAGCSLYQISSTMATGEAFGDDLGRQAEICAAFCAMKPRGMAIEELAVRRDND
jgi:hypothetical protein